MIDFSGISMSKEVPYTTSLSVMPHSFTQLGRTKYINQSIQVYTYNGVNWYVYFDDFVHNLVIWEKCKLFE